jgi:hypothetical protein
MKLTSRAFQCGRASQLIRVLGGPKRWRVRGKGVSSLPISIILAWALAQPRTISAEAPRTSEQQLLAAALRYAAKRARCTADAPCCFSVDGKPPDKELVRLLRPTRGLTPMPGQPQGHACQDWTLHASRVQSSTPNREWVDIAIGSVEPRAPIFLSCNYSLKATASGWAVVPSETSCPVQ